MLAIQCLQSNACEKQAVWGPRAGIIYIYIYIYMEACQNLSSRVARAWGLRQGVYAGLTTKKLVVKIGSTPGSLRKGTIGDWVGLGRFRVQTGLRRGRS